MTRPSAAPRSAALWRAAPLRLVRTPGWLALMLVAATLFVASVVAPPIFSATARSTALSESLGAAAGAPYGPESADLRVTWDAVLLEDGNDYLMSRLGSIEGYGEPVVTGAGVAQNRTRRAIARADPGARWWPSARPGSSCASSPA